MAVIAEVIQEGQLTFTFPRGSMSSKYDEWAHYRNQFNSAFGGTKAVDIVYVDGHISWLIELKDYRQYNRTKTIDIADEVAAKVRDTLVGLVSARLNATDLDEQRMATRLLRSTAIRVVLHLEQPQKKTRLRPTAIDPAAVLLKLKGLVRSIDAHPYVVDQHTLKPNMSWSVV